MIIVLGEMCKHSKLRPLFHIMQSHNSRWIKDLNIKDKAILSVKDVTFGTYAFASAPT